MKDQSKAINRSGKVVINQEYQELEKNKINGVKIEIDKNNQLIWKVFLSCFAGTPYEKGTF